MKPHKLILLTIACTWALAASAQWQWVDKDGSKVFSDRPPPADVPQKNILKEPRGNAAPSAKPAQQPAQAANASGAPSAAAAPAAGASAAIPQLGSGKDKRLEENKAKADAAEAEKKKAEEERVAKSRAENCSRARKYRETLTSGQLLGNTDAQGNRGFMDEAARTAELQRADSVIASDCGNPATQK